MNFTEEAAREFERDFSAFKVSDKGEVRCVICQQAYPHSSRSLVPGLWVDRDTRARTHLESSEHHRSIAKTVRACYCVVRSEVGCEIPL